MVSVALRGKDQSHKRLKTTEKGSATNTRASFSTTSRITAPRLTECKKSHIIINLYKRLFVAVLSCSAHASSLLVVNYSLLSLSPISTSSPHYHHLNYNHLNYHHLKLTK